MISSDVTIQQTGVYTIEVLSGNSVAGRIELEILLNVGFEGERFNQRINDSASIPFFADSPIRLIPSILTVL